MDGIRHYQVFPLHAGKEVVNGLHRPQAPHQCPESGVRTVDSPPARHLPYIAEYTSNLRHFAGVANVLADTLSRPPSGPSVADSQPGCIKEPSVKEVAVG